MSKDPVEYLKHIRDESNFILSVIAKGLTKEDFLNDETLKRAVVRSLEIIGEGTKKIPADFKTSMALKLTCMCSVKGVVATFPFSHTLFSFATV